jgi:hypothetical protein
MQERQLTWRQGNILSTDAINFFSIHLPEAEQESYVVIVSHDCDLSATVDKEPYAEFLIGQKIPKLGSDSYGKNARRLHIQYQTESEPLTLALSAVSKGLINKADLYKFEPRKDLRLDGYGIQILQQWLASRYKRAAFPEAFEERLRSVSIPGKDSFLKKIEVLLSEGGEHIRALLFDLDSGNDVERQESTDLYQLGVYVLYNSLLNEPEAAEAAKRLAESLEDLFSKAFNNGQEWSGLELIYCDPISDSSLTVAQQQLLKIWRLEHMSMREDPPQVMLS